VWRNEADYLIKLNPSQADVQSYVHLISAAIDRMVAGPIGRKQCHDIVNRIIKFETNLPQHKLCIAYPSAVN